MKRTLLAKRYKKWKALPLVDCVKIASGFSERGRFRDDVIYPILSRCDISFVIRDKEGYKAFCLFENCAHLEHGDWEFVMSKSQQTM